jgi:hypothetical protein
MELLTTTWSSLPCAQSALEDGTVRWPRYLRTVARHQTPDSTTGGQRAEVG